MKFNPEMKQAILEDRKNQTRRLMEPQPTRDLHDEIGYAWSFQKDDGTGMWRWLDFEKFKKELTTFAKHKVGDIIPLEDGNGVQFGEGEITAVRVERVQDISEEDCIFEGIHPFAPGGVERGSTIPRKQFAMLWDSIYPGSWKRNDWVWVYEFKTVKGVE